MRTGVTVSKTRKQLSTIAAITGAATIVILAAAFVTTDFNAFLLSPSFTIDSASVEALEPIRSDPRSEQDNASGDENGNNGSGGSGNDSNNGGSGAFGLSDNDDGDGNSGGSNTNGSWYDYPDHDPPCLDPNCPIHHGGVHQIPCGDPNCPICTHEPCGDPNCPICNGHGLPCDDPNCPIHHGGGNGDGSSEDGRPPVDISMEIVRFKPNSDQYVDESEALRILSNYIASFDRYFDRYPDGKIYLVGCIARTANWSLTETELSLARAEAVKRSLIELGVDENKLEALGIGISDPWRNDEWADGYFNEDVAKLNRRVWIVPDEYEAQVGVVLATDELIKSLKESESNE